MRLGQMEQTLRIKCNFKMTTAFFTIAVDGCEPYLREAVLRVFVILYTGLFFKYVGLRRN